MQKIRLPYRKVINYYFFCFFGMPFFMILLAYFRKESKPGDIQSLWFYFFPALLSGLAFSPLFIFKPDDKRKYGKPIIKIRISEFAVIMIAACFGLFVFAGLCDYFEGAYHDAQHILVISLPGTWLLLWALNSNKVWLKDQMMPDIISKKLEKLKADPGCFRYYTDGFTYHHKGNSSNVNWSDVKIIIAYKTDNYTYDTIHLRLKMENGQELDINEDIPGWLIFKETLTSKLPGIDKFWEIKTMAPPFAESATIVYEKN